MVYALNCTILCCTELLLPTNVLYSTGYTNVLFLHKQVLYITQNSTVQYCALLFYIVLCSRILYSTVLSCTILYSTVVYITVIYNKTIYYLYSIVTYYTVQLCYLLYCKLYSTVMHYTTMALTAHRVEYIADSAVTINVAILY